MIANWDLFSAYYSMLVHRFSHSCSLMQQIVILAVPHGMWALSPLTRDQTRAPCIGSMGGS